MLGLLTLLGIALTLLVVILTAIIVWEARRPPRHTAGYAVARGLACDPGEMGLEFEEWMLDRGEGVGLAVWEIASTDDATPAPEGNPLTAILIHGWGHSRIDLLSRVDQWRDHADRLVLYDLRGHGDSTGGLSDLGAGEEDDLLALIERLDASRVLLVGHSMGAVIAIHAASRGDEVASRIAGVVAYGPYADFHTSIQGRLGATGLPSRPLTDLAMMWFRLWGVRHRDLMKDVAKLERPLLVVHGTADEISPFAHAERIVEAAPDATLHGVEGAGHLNAHEFAENAHAAALAKFMQRVSSG